MGLADADRAAWRYATDLARAREEREAAAVLARAAVELSGSSHAFVWIFDRAEGYRLSASWPEAESGSAAARVARAVALGVPVSGPGPKPHRSHLVIPLAAGARPIGALELRESTRAAGPLAEGDLAVLDGLVRAADSALEAARAVASREREHIDTVLRLSLLFDLSRSIASAFDAADLPGLIANRTQNALQATVAVIWVPVDDGARFQVASAVGPGAEEMIGFEAEDGVAGRAMESGEVVLIDDPDELASVLERPGLEESLPLELVAAVPIVEADGEALGVLEAIFDREPELPLRALSALLGEVAAVAAVAMAHARRIKAEERASDLGSLLRIAQDLSSSLDPDRVVFTLVNKAAAVLEFRRAAVGLTRGGKTAVAAISGSAFVDESLPEVKAILDVLRWAADLREGLYVVQEDDGDIDADRPETREKFRAYFASTGTRTALIVPLGDDEGRLGTFLLDSEAPYAFSEREIEAASLLGVQATIAIRNATLYKQIPMSRVFAPLGRQGSRFAAWSGRRRFLTLAASVAALVVLAFPVPLRVGGDARVLPSRRVVTSAEVDGRIARVLVREGDAVRAGQPLAELDDADYRSAAETAEARFQSTLREQSRWRVEGDAGAAGVEAARIEGLRAEVALAQDRLRRTVLRAASSGIVATPRIDERVGQRVARGEAVCEIADTSQPTVDVTVAEADAGLLRPGQPVKVKLFAYPTRSFAGAIDRVGVTAVPVEGVPSLVVRVSLESGGAALAQGMTGRAKVTVTRAPVLRVFFRRPARWIWSAVWGWLP